MKTYIALASIFLLTLLYSCTQTCSCSRNVYSYAGGQIIFYPSQTDSIALHQRDSLAAMYGPARDSSVKVSVLHNSATWTQYENQGFTCGCTK